MRPMIFFLTFFLSLGGLLDGMEWPWSLAEMAKRSVLVADGEIVQIIPEGTEETPIPNSTPFKRTKYKAIFKIDNPLKKTGISDFNFGLNIELIYWKTTDVRYQGDKVPDLNIGDKFRLYAETVVKQDSGEIAVFVHNANAIHPEAYHSKSLTEPTILPTLK